jgi:hypothetical protein
MSTEDSSDERLTRRIGDLLASDVTEQLPNGFVEVPMP